jgi:hypothetical protein
MHSGSTTTQDYLEKTANELGCALFNNTCMKNSQTTRTKMFGVQVFTYYKNMFMEIRAGSIYNTESNNFRYILQKMEPSVSTAAIKKTTPGSIQTSLDDFIRHWVKTSLRASWTVKL